MIAVLLLLMAIALPSFLGSRESAKDRAVQAAITNSYHSAKAIWAGDQAYPALLGAEGLLEQMAAAEPGYAFTDGAPVVAGSQLKVSRDDDQTVTICGLSESGRIYCLRSNEEGNLEEARDADPRGPTFQNAAAVSISRSTATSLGLAECLLGTFPGQNHAATCAPLPAGEGQRGWTSSVSTSQVDPPATEPPTLGLTSTPSDSTATSATFSFDVEDATSVTCALDEQTLGACASPVVLSDLPVGEHQFDVVAANAAGSVTASHTWQVLPLPPVLEWVSTPADSGATTATLAYSLTGPTDTLTCELDGDNLFDCDSPIALSGLDPGPHTVEILAGNVSGDATLSHTWTIYALPTASFTSGPAQDSQTGATSASFAWTTTTTTGSECSLDGAAFAPCTSPQELSGLSVDSHQFRVRATGPGGQVTITRDWEVVPQPTVTITSGPAEGSTQMNAYETFTWTSANAAGFTCSFNGGTPASCTSPYTTPLIGVGAHTVSITANGPGGSVTATRNWNVDINPSSYLAEVLNDNPTSYWRMDQATGVPVSTGVVTDYKGANHGDYAITTASSGNNGRSAFSGKSWGFDGVNGALRVPHHASLRPSSGTIELWLNRFTDTGRSEIIFEKQGDYAIYFAPDDSLRFFNNGATEYVIGSPGQFASANSSNSPQPSAGNWRHVVITYTTGSPGTLKAYVDGVERSVSPAAGTISMASGSNLFIGSRGSGGIGFHGFIDDVAIYPSVLSPARIAAHYAANVDPES